MVYGPDTGICYAFAGIFCSPLKITLSRHGVTAVRLRRILREKF